MSGRTTAADAAALGMCLSSAIGVASAQVPASTVGADDTDQSLQQVTVQGVRSLLHDKLPEEQHNTPQSITVVTSQVMATQANTRLEDALKNVPGITLNSGEGAARGDTVNLRGFSAFNDFFLDGIRDAAVYTRDSFDLESVEVVKGPSAVLFGRGSTGGAINQVSKAPLMMPLDRVTTEIGTSNLYRSTTDLNAPIGTASAARLNAMVESSDIADRDVAENHRWGVAPAVSFGIGESNTLTLAYLHQHENDIPDPGIPFVFGQPASVPRDAYFGLAGDRQIANDDIATLRLRHEFNDSVSIADTLRYAHYAFSYLDTIPNFGTDVPQPGTPLDGILVGRDAPGSSGVQTNWTEQLDLTARFATGPLTHLLTTGVEFEEQTNDLNRNVNPFNRNNRWIPETSLLVPNPYEPLPGVQPVSSVQDTTAHASAAYVTDVVGLTSLLDLLAGVRYDRFSADYHQLTTATGALLNLDHADNLLSPRAALIFKPVPSQSYYLSYGTSFDPSAEALTLTTKTANLGPVKAKTYEAGVKTAWLDNRLSATGAVFHTEVDNAQTNDPENPSITTLDGNQRVNGFELAAFGYLTGHLELIAGYTYLDGKTIESGTSGYVGKELPNTARSAVNLWAEYELSSDLEVGAGGNYLGHRYADYAQSVSVPGYVVMNAMVSYRVLKRLQLQVNVFNLFNRFYLESPYYTSAAENHVVPGAGRSAALTLRLTL